MPYNEKKKAYNVEYAKTHLKRVPLEMQKDLYEEIKKAAEDCGESVNGYIKGAIAMRLKKKE